MAELGANQVSAVAAIGTIGGLCMSGELPGGVLFLTFLPRGHRASVVGMAENLNSTQHKLGW